MARYQVMWTSKWISLTIDSYALGYEAAAVIALRLFKLGRLDPAAITETHLMLNEKLGAAAELQMRAWTGGLGFTPYDAIQNSLTFYRRAIRKNRRRLSRRQGG